MKANEIKPVDFELTNVEIGANQKDEYEPFKARFEEAEGRGIVTVCYRVPFLKRLELLLYGRLYISENTFGYPITIKSLYIGSYKKLEKYIKKNLQA